MWDKNILYYGSSQKLPESISLQAGPLALNYSSGEISVISFQRMEAVQRIYANVRDRNWGTIPNNIFSEKINQQKDNFEITFNAESIQEEINFFWEGRIIGSTVGEITFSFNGEARSNFLTCRIGFCVLHPLKTCMAKACRIINHSGQQLTGIFPTVIAPAQIPPFLDMRAMEYEITPGVNVNLLFEGDLFEMEDQRNWTDASYKTFCTPLRLKYPRDIKAGFKISQKVTLKLISDKKELLSIPRIQSEEIISINLNPQKVGKIPEIGLGSPSHDQEYSDREISRLKALNLSHLRLELDNISTSNAGLIRKKLLNTKKIDIPIELILYLSDFENELSILLDILEKIDCTIARWIIFEEGKNISAKESLLITRRLLEGRKNILIGGGSNADFYELNSQKVPFELLDFVFYSMNPQVHRSDISSLVDNIQTPAMTVESALRISAGKPVVISPITLKPRFNPAATEPAVKNETNEIPSTVDPRQMSLFAAGWTIGSLHNLLNSQAISLTYYETIGWQGVMENESGSPLPDKFHSVPGGVFPLYHIFADVGEFRNGNLLETTSSDERCVVSLGMENQENQQLLFANLTPKKQEVKIFGMRNTGQIRLLDETNALYAMQNPEVYRSNVENSFSGNQPMIIELMPFAIARVISK